MAKVAGSSAGFALPAPEGLEICKILGLAISNVSMYGMEHSVTATSVSQAYDGIVNKADLYGEIEFVLGDAGLMINQSVIETERSTGQLLVDQLTKQGVHDFAFVPPVNRGEFTRFMLILAAAPGSSLVADGFESAVADASMKSVRVANVSYARVDKNAPAPDAFASPTPTSRQANPAGGAKSFDLDMDLDMGMDGFSLGDDSLSPSGDLAVASAAGAYLEQKQAAESRREALLAQIRERGGSPTEREALREQLLAAGLSKSDWFELLAASGVAASAGTGQAAETLQQLLLDIDVLAHGDAVSTGQPTPAMTEMLDAISQQVLQLTSQTTQRVDTLAEKVDADRETVAHLENEARARGVGPNLSRDELLGSLAEINQELAQPLSAASAVIDILGGGKLGAVTEAQREVLDVASQGMERLGKLVEYLNKISGMPDGLSPDREILDGAYGES
ncbi:MAG: hypothetical protein HN341_10130 [Verrucomicrobia bacterium]|jgi:hypothetical protein|nr:hypothetical protein [Verrucomicrobiota bacterium]